MQTHHNNQRIDSLPPIEGLDGLGGIIDAVASNWIKGTRDKKEVQLQKRALERDDVRRANEAAFMRRQHKRALFQNAQLAKAAMAEKRFHAVVEARTSENNMTTIALLALAGGAWLVSRKG